MHGRLGNQLFQYAAARELQEKNGQEIKISFRQINGANTEGNTGWENSLKFFDVHPFIIYKGKKSLLSEMPLETRFLCSIYAASYRPFMNNFTKWYRYQTKWCGVLDKMGIRWIANGYYDFKFDHLKDYLLNGTFEAPDYFNDIREKLLQEIRPLSPKLSQNKDLYRIIENTNSVCVSLRHFRLHGTEADNYDVCGIKYYETGINFIKNSIENVNFIIFSDDVEWARSVIEPMGVKAIYETPNNPVWEKLRLMYSCKHFIIPNSTFAWWAQYLGKDANKVVVGPEKWFNSDFDSPLVLKSWIRIDRDGNLSLSNK